MDADLVARITSALADSAYLIVLCSPHAARSRWVDEEVVRFQSLHGAARILTVIVDGSPGDGPEQCFPPALRYRENDDRIADQPEPVAADLRPGGDGKRMTRLKLVAGMLGVGLDELIRRDDRRRHRRLVAVTAASLTGVVLAGALATAALIARNDSQKQRFHAEELIEFMLTDLRKQLEPGGHLDAMDGVGREALKYYQSQKAANLDVQSLTRRARALRLMGEIRVQRGDLDDALQSFQEASGTTYELLARSPGDGQVLFNHAQNVFWMGEIAHQRGDLAKAEVSFRQYRGLAEQLAAIDPANKDWRAELVYADSALGVLYLQQGHLLEATTAFQRSMAAAELLGREYPNDVNWQIELAQGHAWLADALQKQGHLEEARTHAETQLQIYRGVLVKDPTVRQARFSTVDALQTLGRLAVIEDDKQCAQLDFQESARQAEDLLSGENGNMDLTGVAAVTQIDLGEALLGSGQIGASRIAQQRADQLLTMALSHDETVAAWRNYQVRSILLRASIAASIGQSTEALQLDQSELTRLNGEASSASNTEGFWLLQRARLQTGDDLAALGRIQEAHALWTTIVKNLSEPTQGFEPKLLTLLAAAEMRLGQHAEAEHIIKPLREHASHKCDEQKAVSSAPLA